MNVVLIVLGAVLVPVWLAMGIAVVALVLPFRVEAGGRYGRRTESRVRLRWPAGLLRVDYRAPAGVVCVRLCGLRVYRRRGAGGGQTSLTEFRVPRPTRSQSAWHVVNALPSLCGHVRQVWRSLEIRGKMRCVFGLDDPADTAIAAGALAAARSMVPVPVELVPDFRTQGVELEGWIRARPWPIQLAGIALTMILTSDTRNLVRGR